MKNGICGIVGLVLMSAFFAGCGPKSSMHEESIAEIEKLGGKVERDWFLGGQHGREMVDTERVHRVNFSGTEVTDAGLAHLEGLTELTTLYLPPKPPTPGWRSWVG